MKERKIKLSTIILTIIIIILLIIIGVLVMNISNTKIATENCNNVEEKNEEEIVKDEEIVIDEGTLSDAQYFDSYLDIFLPQTSAGNFMQTIESFSNEDLTTYLFFYYVTMVKNGKLTADDPEAIVYTYTVSKTEMDKVIYKYFGIEDYEIVESGGRAGIKKLDNGDYQVYWFGTGWMVPTAFNIGVIYSEDEVEVRYMLINTETREDEGDLIIYLTKNKENYNVTKIEYVEK